MLYMNTINRLVKKAVYGTSLINRCRQFWLTLAVEGLALALLWIKNDASSLYSSLTSYL
jgi:hypothetical protein